MKRILGIVAAGLVLAALAFGGASVIAQTASTTYNTSNYHANGGAYWGVGGVLDVLSGGTLKFNGVTTNIARGEATLSGSNPTGVATGLTTISSCTVTLKNTSAPTPTMWLTYGTSSATLNIYGWKPTSTSNVTAIASGGTETVGWTCKGT